MGVFSESQVPAIAMQQNKLQSSRSSSRLVSVPKRLWKARAKSQTRIATGHATGLWIPEGHCRWKSTCGQRVVLQPVNILQMSEIERSAYQQVAMVKLKTLNLPCDIPKETSPIEKPKRRPALLRRKAATTSLFEGRNRKNKDEDNKTSNENSLVFGIPLSKCVQNDRARKQRSGSLMSQDQLMTVGSPDTNPNSAFGRRSESLNDDLDSSFRLKGVSGSAESLPVLRPYSDGVLDFNTSVDDRPMFRSLLYGRGPQVPQVIKACFRHLETHGLNTLGLFRVSSSKKRVRQLREDFDSGQEMQLSSDYHPHDIAQLLKEYFRDLPDPLLTRDLYGPLLTTLRYQPTDQFNAQRWLISLLPVYNRDTLWALTNFLAKVVENSNDRRSPSGELLTGNKMDAHNLATLFGPNILRFSQNGKGKEFLVENNARAEERSDVILVVRNLLENQKKLFEATADDMDAVYRRLQIEDPEALDAVMKWRFHNQLEAEITDKRPSIGLPDPRANKPVPSVTDQNFIRPLTLAEDAPSRSNPNYKPASLGGSGSSTSSLTSTSTGKSSGIAGPYTVTTGPYVTTYVTTSTKYRVQEATDPRDGNTGPGGGGVMASGRQVQITTPPQPMQRRESRIRYSIQVNERKNAMEKSASTSAILHPRVVDPEELSGSPERPVAPPRVRSSQQQQAKGLTSILIGSDTSIRRKSKGTTNVTTATSGSAGVRFQNERWKRWEIIASEYTEQGTLN